MSQLYDLRRKKGALKKSKRVGRGNASGWGTYAGRGLNGQNSRTGGGVRPGFEGGQTPLYRKMPKLKGFKNVNRLDFQVVNIEKLNGFEDNEEIDIMKLYEKNLIRSKSKPVKILGDGDLTKKLTVKVDRVSRSAKEKIEKAKGKVIELIQVSASEKTPAGPASTPEPPAAEPAPEEPAEKEDPKEEASS